MLENFKIVNKLTFIRYRDIIKELSNGGCTKKTRHLCLIRSNVYVNAILIADGGGTPLLQINVKINVGVRFHPDPFKK